MKAVTVICLFDSFCSLDLHKKNPTERWLCPQATVCSKGTPNEKNKRRAWFYGKRVKNILECIRNVSKVFFFHLPDYIFN